MKQGRYLLNFYSVCSLKGTWDTDTGSTKMKKKTNKYMEINKKKNNIITVTKYYKRLGVVFIVLYSIIVFDNPLVWFEREGNT